MLVRLQKKNNGGAGTVEQFLMMNPGEIIKFIAVQNVTRAWAKASVHLASQKTTTGAGRDQTSIMHENIQAGSRYVTWRGKETIHGPFIFIIGQYFNCSAADELWLIIGYEPAVAKRGWGL